MRTEAVQVMEATPRFFDLENVEQIATQVFLSSVFVEMMDQGQNDTLVTAEWDNYFRYPRTECSCLPDVKWIDCVSSHDEPSDRVS